MTMWMWMWIWMMLCSDTRTCQWACNDCNCSRAGWVYLYTPSRAAEQPSSQAKQRVRALKRSSASLHRFLCVLVSCVVFFFFCLWTILILILLLGCVIYLRPAYANRVNSKRQIWRLAAWVGSFIGFLLAIDRRTNEFVREDDQSTMWGIFMMLHASDTCTGACPTGPVAYANATLFAAPLFLRCLCELCMCWRFLLRSSIQFLGLVGRIRNFPNGQGSV